MSKFTGGFSLVLVALVIVGATGFFKITGVQTVVKDLSDIHVPLLNIVSEVDVLATEQELAATQFALHNEKDFIATFEALDKSADQKFEAARAGEAGAGFAMVADEVRNLAMRAADAAKNTANLIEGTVKKVGQGSELVSGTNEAFRKVAESASKVGELVGESRLLPMSNPRG